MRDPLWAKRFCTLGLITSLVLYVVKKSSAQAAVEDTEKIFTELIQSIEALCFETTEMIKAKEQTELDEAHGFMEKLEQEISEFKRRDAEYDTIARLDDKTQFLKVTSVLLGTTWVLVICDFDLRVYLNLFLRVMKHCVVCQSW